MSHLGAWGGERRGPGGQGCCVCQGARSRERCWEAGCHGGDLMGGGGSGIWSMSFQHSNKNKELLGLESCKKTASPMLCAIFSLPRSNDDGNWGGFSGGKALACEVRRPSKRPSSLGALGSHTDELSPVFSCVNWGRCENEGDCITTLPAFQACFSSCVGTSQGSSGRMCSSSLTWS